MVLVLIVGSLIITAIIVLPFALKAVLNNVLQKMEGYTGQINRLRINPFESRITLQDIRINTDTGDKYYTETPLLLIPAIVIGFKWRPFLKKQIYLNIIIDKPKVLFIAENPLQSEDQGSNISREIPSLKRSIEKLMAFRINVDVRDGTVCYANSKSGLDITVTEIYLSIRDFSNRRIISNSCQVVGKCHLYDGIGEITATVLPLEPTLTVDLNLNLTSINLVLLNSLLQRYGRVDLNKGTLNLFAEVMVSNNSFKGYIKPVLKELDFISAADRGDNLLRKIWERFVAGFYNVLENNRNDQVATKIPIEGRLDDPHIRVGVAIMLVLRNAFVKALTPSLDNVINLVRGEATQNKQLVSGKAIQS